MSTPQLISFPLCPYVQRAAIALAEKGVPFERTDIDLADKPAWFTDISPLGKVPVLKAGEAVLFESAVICEYLDETTPNRLHPDDPLERARHRAWMEFGSAVLGDIAGLYAAPDAGSFERKRAQLAERFEWVERNLGDGPFFAGERFSLVDAVFGPIFRYFDVFDSIADLSVFEGKPKVQAWREQLRNRPSVQGAVANDYPERLRRFLKAKNSHLSGLMAA